MQLSSKCRKRFLFSISYKYPQNPTAILLLLSKFILQFAFSLSSFRLHFLPLHVFVFSLLGFCSETMAEEAQNGGGAVKEATKAAVVFTAVKPQLFVEAPKANDAVQFYKGAFGAEEVARDNHPKRKAEQERPLILSVELKLGSFTFVVSDLTDEDSTAPYVFLIFAFLNLFLRVICSISSFLFRKSSDLWRKLLYNEFLKQHLGEPFRESFCGKGKRVAVILKKRAHCFFLSFSLEVFFYHKVSSTFDFFPVYSKNVLTRTVTSNVIITVFALFYVSYITCVFGLRRCFWDNLRAFRCSMCYVTVDSYISSVFISLCYDLRFFVLCGFENADLRWFCMIFVFSAF